MDVQRRHSMCEGLEDREISCVLGTEAESPQVRPTGLVSACILPGPSSSARYMAPSVSMCY